MLIPIKSEGAKVQYVQVGARIFPLPDGVLIAAAKTWKDLPVQEPYSGYWPKAEGWRFRIESIVMGGALARHRWRKRVGLSCYGQIDHVMGCRKDLVDCWRCQVVIYGENFYPHGASWYKPESRLRRRLRKIIRGFYA